MDIQKVHIVFENCEVFEMDFTPYNQCNCPMSFSFDDIDEQAFNIGNYFIHQKIARKVEIKFLVDTRRLKTMWQNGQVADFEGNLFEKLKNRDITSVYIYTDSGETKFCTDWPDGEQFQYTNPYQENIFDEDGTCTIKIEKPQEYQCQS